MNNSNFTAELLPNNLDYSEIGEDLSVKRIIPQPTYQISLGGMQASLTKAQLLKLYAQIGSILAVEDTDPVITAAMLVVSGHFGMTVTQMLSPTRTDRHVRARNYAIQICFDLGCRNQSELGRAFKRDHGTIMHALSCNKDRMELYPAMKRELELLRDQVEQQLNEIK